MGDVGDVHLGGGWWDGKGRRPNHPTTGGWQDAKKRAKKSGLLVHLQQDPAGTPYRSGGGVWTRLVVGYTWTWASLGFPTGLFLIELRKWSTLERG